MKIGLSTWSLLQSDLHSAIRAIGDAGFDYIELWGEVPHAYHSWVNKKRLKDTLSTYNFTVSMHAPFTDLNPAAPFEPIKGAVVKTLKEFVAFSDDLGAVRVTFHPGSVHSGALVPQSMGDVVDLLRQLVKESGGSPAINIENQPKSKSHYHFPVGSDSESIQALLANVEGTSYTLDTGHAHVNGMNPIDLYESFRENVTEIHLHDNDGTSDEHLCPGRGTANLGGFLDKVRGTEILVCLELNPFIYSEGDVLEAAAGIKRGIHG
jgi:sugar phosphate isomerase/epimerase